MKFLAQFVADHELKVPRRAPNDEKGAAVDWSEFNYPESFPLIRFKPGELKDAERKQFVDVG